MRAVILALAFGAASAFMGAPVAPKARSSSAIKMTTQDELAALAESNRDALGAGIGFWDPLGCSKMSFWTLSNEETIGYLRHAEIKHGRVAMVAFLGLFFGEKLGFIFGSQITGPAIYQYQQAEGILNAWTYNVLGLALAVEGFNIIKGWQDFSESYDEVGIAGLKGADEYTNGDLSFDPLGLKPDNESDLKKMMNKELNNGRLAMLGFVIGLGTELLTGQGILSQIGLG